MKNKEYKLSQIGFCEIVQTNEQERLTVSNKLFKLMQSFVCGKSEATAILKRINNGESIIASKHIVEKMRRFGFIFKEEEHQEEPRKVEKTYELEPIKEEDGIIRLEGSIKTIDEKIENLEISLHSEFCEKGRELNKACYCKNHTYKPYRLKFEYRYKTYLVKVNSCIRADYVNFPISLVFEKAISIINKQDTTVKISKKIVVLSTKDYYSHDVKSKNEGISEGEVMEIIYIGGSHYNYYVTHKIKDLDFNKIINQPISRDSLKCSNIGFLSKKINKRNVFLDKLVEQEY